MSKKGDGGRHVRKKRRRETESKEGPRCAMKAVLQAQPGAEHRGEFVAVLKMGAVFPRGEPWIIQEHIGYGKKR